MLHSKQRRRPVGYRLARLERLESRSLLSVGPQQPGDAPQSTFDPDSSSPAAAGEDPIVSVAPIETMSMRYSTGEKPQSKVWTHDGYWWSIFSDDDGTTWTEPLVVARKAGGNLSYPYIFEVHPGELWIRANAARLSLKEADFVEP